MKQIEKKNCYPSSFLACEKDAEKICQKLFQCSKHESDYLKRLLVVNTKDCIDNWNEPIYQNAIKDMNIPKLKEKGYLRLVPKIFLQEHEEVMSYIVISFDNFTPNTSNPEFRDCIVQIDIICHTDCWDLGDFRTRPLRIAGFIDNKLHKSRLSGIGQLFFYHGKQIILNDYLAGYTLYYHAIHWTDDYIPRSEE